MKKRFIVKLVLKTLAYLSCMTMLYSLMLSLEREYFAHILIAVLATTGTFLFTWWEMNS